MSAISFLGGSIGFHGLGTVHCVLIRAVIGAD